MVRKIPKKLQQQLEQMALDFSERMRLAEKRVGNTSEDRLRWVFEFAKSDLPDFNEEDMVNASYCLRVLEKPGKWHTTSLFGPFPMPMLASIHGEIKRGIQALFNEKRDNEWIFPPPKGVTLHRQSPLTSKQTRLQLFYVGDEVTVILGGVLDLLLECQRSIRACERCKWPFVRTRKRMFCSEDCSQAERNARKKKEPK